MYTQIIQNQLEDKDTDLHECRELQRQPQQSKDQEKRMSQERERCQMKNYFDIYDVTNVTVILVHVPDYLQAV